MTPVTSAGILLHRSTPGGTEVFLGRMGGPFWARRPRAWSIPKSVHTPDEAPLDAARREFEEEVGAPAPEADYTLLGSFRQRSGKIVTVFAARADESVRFVSSNTFELEWPRGSGTLRAFPEMETAAWHPIDEARGSIVVGQVPALDALEALLASAQ